MKVFVWNEVAKATDRYHSGGGIVVFAETLERAIELASAEGADILAEDFPDDVRDTHGPEACYIMPDAGCC